MQHCELNLTDWRLRADTEQAGVTQRWFEPASAAAGSGDWRAVRLPCASQRVFGEDFHNVTWLRTEVELSHEWRFALTRLRFEAVATEARVWVNGEFAGSHSGDYLPFDIDITRFARPGATLHLVVRVDEVANHITKGFHDLTSVHHGGIWQPVRLLGSAKTCALPDGVAVTGLLRKEQAVVHVDLAQQQPGARARITIADPAGRQVYAGDLALSPHADSYKIHCGVAGALPWQPDDPQLYTARIELHDEAGASETHELRFGFRDVRTTQRHILLNEAPIFLSGVLHWGHEPEHLAPAPTPAQVREEFARLKAMGFNCVCLCMWYPPEHFFQIADEMGMLIWQEHPVWQSRMDDADVPEYQRNYRGFLRRDRKHTCAIIVSATCEHPKFHAGLADFWWRTARVELANTLLQLQTASFAWADHDRTDLHDEHTYDNNDRWPHFLEDLQETLAGYHAKPFVMGESVLFHSWPDVAALREKSGGEAACYLPDCLADMQRLEDEWGQRYGDDFLPRFRRQGDRHHLLGRKFQYELFRRYPNHAGLVMNHLVDVHQCTCGFMDALRRWRFDPNATRPWLCPAPLLLRTPGERRFFAANERIDCEILLSNFSGEHLDGPCRVTLSRGDTGEAVLRETTAVNCPPGEVARAPLRLALPAADRPTLLTLRAEMSDTIANQWDLWAVPQAPLPATGVYRLDGLPYDEDDRRLDKEETGYSCGFGIACERWQRQMPDPQAVAPEAATLAPDEAVPAEAQFIIAHRLTSPLLRYLEAGGNVLLLASKAAGSIETKYLWLFGQTPLILETGPLREGDSEWMLDGLCFDLNFANGRAIDSRALGLIDHVEPIVRLAYTHGTGTQVALYDQLIATRVGEGTLIVSALDHACPPGCYLLARLIDWARSGAAAALPALPREIYETLPACAEAAAPVR